MTVNMLSPESKVKILSASERLADPPGAKILLAGASGVGKTSLVRTLNVERTVVLDVAGGLLSIADVPVRTVQIRDWPSLRDIVCRLGGPDPSYLATSPYSPAHFAAVGGPFPGPDDIDTVVLDDIGEAGRIAFRWAAQQPEAVTKSGAKDLLAIYGIVARELIELFQHLQHARKRNIVLIAILETERDEFKRPFFQIQLEGAKAGRELPGIVDEVITMAFVDFGDAVPVRAFVCTSPNKWNFPAKDRSGKLEQLEEPHLGKLIRKITGR